MSLIQALRRRALEWATGAAATLAALTIITPAPIDWLLNALMVGLVWIAGKLTRP